LQKQVWTINKLLSWAIEFFKSKNIANPRLSAELLLSHTLNLSRIDLYLNHDYVLKEDELKKYKEYIIKRLNNIPIQYITNQSYFRKLKLFVDERVLIPRPETELVVEKAKEIIKTMLEQKKSLNILEIGIGSGAISLSLITEIKNDIKIIATEKNPKAIEVAIINSELILNKDKLSNLAILNCDVVPEDDKEFDLKYKNNIDILISNPPYISNYDFENLDDEIKKYEPKDALVAGPTGIEAYEKILKKSKPYLNLNNSFIIFETDQKTSVNLAELCRKYFENSEVAINKDYNNLDRIVVASIK